MTMIQKAVPLSDGRSSLIFDSTRLLDVCVPPSLLLLLRLLPPPPRHQRITTVMLMHTSIDFRRNRDSKTDRA